MRTPTDTLYKNIVRENPNNAPNGILPSAANANHVRTVESANAARIVAIICVRTSEDFPESEIEMESEKGDVEEEVDHARAKAESASTYHDLNHPTPTRTRKAAPTEGIHKL